MRSAWAYQMLPGYIYFSYFFKFYLFIFREGKGGRVGEKHRCGRETSIPCLSHTPWQEMELTSQSRALPSNQTGDLSLFRMTPNQLSHAGQGSSFPLVSMSYLIASRSIPSLLKLPRIGFCCWQSITMTDTPASLLDCYQRRGCVYMGALWTAKPGRNVIYHSTPNAPSASSPHPAASDRKEPAKQLAITLAKRNEGPEELAMRPQNRSLMLHLIITSPNMTFAII